MGSGQPVAMCGQMTFANKFFRIRQDSWAESEHSNQTDKKWQEQNSVFSFHILSSVHRLKSPIHPPVRLSKSKCQNGFPQSQSVFSNRPLTGRLLNSDKLTTIGSESDLLKPVTSNVEFCLARPQAPFDSDSVCTILAWLPPAGVCPS